MPKRLAPMLAQSGTLPSDGTDWAYEFKWDGVRAVVFAEKGAVRALSRNDKDLALSFTELSGLARVLGPTTAILDGEVVAFDADGRPSFGRLQQRLHLAEPEVVARRAVEYPVSYLAFDLLYLNGHSTIALPYDDRRELLESLELSGEHFATPPSITDADGDSLLALSAERGLEGLVAKRRRSVYQPGRRSPDWVKVKNFRTQEVLIGGWTEGQGERSGSLGALLLGIPEVGGLSYVGKVGTGFNESDRRELLQLLEPLTQEASPFASPLTRAEARLAHFVRPELVGEVQYGEWTGDQRLRHPSWRGLRVDKAPGEVARED